MNRSRHGVSFEMARLAFNDVFAVEFMDERHVTSEERFNLLGLVGDHILFVSYTTRENRVRIISARKAGPFERRTYMNENQIYLTGPAWTP